ATNRDQAQRRAASDHRQSGSPSPIQECWFRGLLIDAGRTGRLYQGSARGMGKDDQGRQYSIGLSELVLVRTAGLRSLTREYTGELALHFAARRLLAECEPGNTDGNHNQRTYRKDRIISERCPLPRVLMRDPVLDRRLDQAPGACHRQANP